MDEGKTDRAASEGGKVTPRIAALILAGVIGGGCSQTQSHNFVRAHFPDAEIEPVPGSSYEWIVRRSNVVTYVYCSGATGADGLLKIPLFGGK